MTGVRLFFLSGIFFWGTPASGASRALDPHDFFLCPTFASPPLRPRGGKKRQAPAHLECYKKKLTQGATKTHFSLVPSLPSLVPLAFYHLLTTAFHQVRSAAASSISIGSSKNLPTLTSSAIPLRLRVLITRSRASAAGGAGSSGASLTVLSNGSPGTTAQ